MVSNWILDISIGFLLLLSIGYFYEKTVIFYTMFNWWMMIFLLPFVAVYSLIDQTRETSIDNPELPLQTKYIEPIKASEQYNLVQSIAIATMWLIPIVVDLIIGGTAIITAHLLNSNLNLDDIYVICLTSPVLLLIPCLSKRIYAMLSNNIKYTVYESGVGSIGVIANIFVIEWSGYSIARILGIAL